MVVYIIAHIHTIAIGFTIFSNEGGVNRRWRTEQPSSLTSISPIAIINTSIRGKEDNASMLQYKIATSADIAGLMAIRLEMLREVNFLSKDYVFSEEFCSYSRDYFLNGQHTTVLAVDEEKGVAIGCATLCYMELMPTFSHPTGRRAHLMNVYTAPNYREQGIARRMVEWLIEEARRRGVTEISLDATASGRPLYRKLGFQDSGECMVLVLK